MTLSVNSQALNYLLNPIASAVGQGIRDRWSFTCWAGNRVLLSRSGVFTVTSSQRNTSTRLPMSNQTPSTCTVKATASWLLGAQVGLLGLNLLDVSDQVTATTAVPGAMWTSAGTSVSRCATAANNRNTPGTRVVIWNCQSSLANYWIQAPNREIVHNGACLTKSGSRATLQNCTGRPSQIWFNGGHNRQVRSKAGGCLTATSLRAGTQLRVLRCYNRANQRWWIPNRSRS